MPHKFRKNLGVRNKISFHFSFQNEKLIGITVQPNHRINTPKAQNTMMNSRVIATRFAGTASRSTAKNLHNRSLSSQSSIARDKLRDALQEYREQNFTRCVPSRFQKEIIKAATINNKTTVAVAKENSKTMIPASGMLQLISNIRMEHKVTPADVETLFAEIGAEGNGTDKVIPAERLIQMITF